MNRHRNLLLFVMALLLFVLGSLITPTPESGTTQPPPVMTSAGPSAPATPAPAAAPKVIKSFADLTEVLHKDPKSIKKLIIVNGTNEVIVEREGSEPTKVTIPDKYGQEYIMSEADKANVKVDNTTHSNGLSNFLWNWGPTLLFVFIIWWSVKVQMRQHENIEKKVVGEGPKDAQANQEPVFFSDVAGCDEAKLALEESVDHLKHPGRRGLLGGKAPGHVLLIGSPGNGKTLLARAVAGEAKVPFFEMSGSDFVEMFVGVGAARVRKLFKQAKENAPCVVFIDEIDAVGRQRGTGLGGGHDEREQTLNQLLVELDGFSKIPGILVIAATNRPDILDEALLRPGRLGRQIPVDHPDLMGRQAIFNIHLKAKKTAANIDVKGLAELTPGYSGAQIAGTTEEAITVCLRRHKKAIQKCMSEGMTEAQAEAACANLLEITQGDLSEGIDVVAMGPARESRAQAMSKEDIAKTSKHELGHAILTSILKGGDPVTKITVMPRARALGWTQALPEGDRWNYNREQLLARIIMAMGGRAAQEVLDGEVDTGASNDYQQAYQMARKMVVSFGMSKLGPISVSDDHTNPFLGKSMASPASIGPALANRIDEEIRCILNGCLKKAKELVKEHEAFLRQATDILVQKETILGPEWKELLAANNIPLHQVAVNIDCGFSGAAVDDDNENGDC